LHAAAERAEQPQRISWLAPPPLFDWKLCMSFRLSLRSFFKNDFNSSRSFASSF
jgi:hypothetical protein